MPISGRWYESGEQVTLTDAAGQVTRVEWQADRVGTTAPAAPPDSATGPDAWWLAPAFLDLQLNGFSGHDFNRHWRDDQQDEAAETFRAIVDRASQAGTGMLCPRGCPGSREQMGSPLTAIGRARETEARLAAAMPAVHVEGP